MRNSLSSLSGNVVQWIDCCHIIAIYEPLLIISQDIGINNFLSVLVTIVSYLWVTTVHNGEKNANKAG